MFDMCPLSTCRRMSPLCLRTTRPVWSWRSSGWSSASGTHQVSISLGQESGTSHSFILLRLDITISPVLQWCLQTVFKWGGHMMVVVGGGGGGGAQGGTTKPKKHEIISKVPLYCWLKLCWYENEEWSVYFTRNLTDYLTCIIQNRTSGVPQMSSFNEFCWNAVIHPDVVL